MMKKRMGRIAILALALLACLGATLSAEETAGKGPAEGSEVVWARAASAGSGEAAARKAREWTVMVYLCGSDLGAYAREDLEEMSRSGFDEDRVNVVVYTGGASSWGGADIPINRNAMIEVHDRRIERVGEYPLSPMSAGMTLNAFLKRAVERYPAEKYALILWDHGGGPMNGVCYDALFPGEDGNDRLELGELGRALSKSPFGAGERLEWIGFDACLMSAMETARICAPYSRYMIASQETEPGSGWDYSFLGKLEPGEDGEAAARRIIEGYVREGGADEQMLTLSCVDLAKLGQVEAAMNGLFSRLDAMLEPKRFSEVSNGRRDAKGFGRASTGSEYDLVDLYSLSEQYADAAPEQAAALQAALAEAVVVNGGNQADSRGLSVYYPYYNKEYYRARWGRAYGEWGVEGGYRDFMNHYAEVWLGEQLADWTGIQGKAESPGAETQEVTLQLTPEQAANYAFAQLFIVGKLNGSDPYYYKIDEIDDVALDDAGALHALYDYKALYAVDENGAPLCDAIPYRIVDGYYLIRANLTDKTWNQYWGELFPGRDFVYHEDATIDARKVYLQCLPNAAGDGLEVVGVIDMREQFGEGADNLLSEGEGLYTGKQSISIDMEGWNWVWFFHFPRELRRDERGNLLPFEEWVNPNGNGKITLAWEEIDNHEPWSLKFLNQQYTGRDLYAQYIVHDTQGNLTGSNLIPVANPNRIPVATLNETLYESEAFRLTLTGIDLARATFDDGIFLRFELEDRRPERGEISVSVPSILLDRCLLTENYRMDSVSEVDNLTEYVLNIPTKNMPDMLEETLGRVRLEVSIYDEENHDVLEQFSVGLDREIDISAIHACVADQKVLAEARASDVTYRLLGLEEKDDALALTVYADYRGGEALERGWRDTATVNGCEWYDAAGVMYLELPESCWLVRDVVLYEQSPDLDATANSDGIPPYSYPERWGIFAVRRMEFTDWNDEIIRFDLKEPFALKAAESAEGPGYEGEEPLRLLDTGEVSVELVGLGARHGKLRLILDFVNHTGRPLEFLPQYLTVNGASVLSSDLESLNSLSMMQTRFSAAKLSAGRRRRLALVLKWEGEAGQGIETVGLGLEYRPEGEEVWKWCSPATIAVEGAPTLKQLRDGAFRLDSVALLGEGELLDEQLRDPASLVDLAWDVPGDASACAVTLRAPLTPAQAERFESAIVNLVKPTEEGMWYVARLDAPVTQAEGPALRCDFSGLLIQAEGSDYIPCQRITPTDDGLIYDLKAMTVYTDLPLLTEYNVSIDELRIGVKPGDGEATLEAVELSRRIDVRERLETLEFWTIPWQYSDGEGSALESGTTLIGDGVELEGGPVRLRVRPAEAFDPLVLFCVTNRDGSEYTIPVSYRDATAG